MHNTFAAQCYQQLGSEPVASGRTAVAHPLALALQETRACGFAEQPSAEYDDGHASLAGENERVVDRYDHTGGDEQKPFCDGNIEIQGEWTEPNESELPYNFSIVCGTYGGDRRDGNVQQHIIDDIRDIPGSLFCFQEATEAFCQELRASWTSKEDFGRRKPDSWTPEEKRLLVVRGTEKGKSTAVAVKVGVFKALRRDLFILQDAGTYETENKTTKEARNRLMFCTVKFRMNYFVDEDQCDCRRIGGELEENWMRI